MRMIKERFQVYTFEDMEQMTGILARKGSYAGDKPDWSVVADYDAYVIELTYPAIDSGDVDDALIEFEYDVLGS